MGLTIEEQRRLTAIERELDHLRAEFAMDPRKMDVRARIRMLEQEYHELTAPDDQRKGQNAIKWSDPVVISSDGYYFATAIEKFTIYAFGSLIAQLNNKTAEARTHYINNPTDLGADPGQFFIWTDIARNHLRDDKDLYQFNYGQVQLRSGAIHELFYYPWGNRKKDKYNADGFNEFMWEFIDVKTGKVMRYPNYDTPYYIRNVYTKQLMRRDGAAITTGDNSQHTWVVSHGEYQAPKEADQDDLSRIMDEVNAACRNADNYATCATAEFAKRGGKQLTLNIVDLAIDIIKKAFGLIPPWVLAAVATLFGLYAVNTARQILR